MRRQLVGLLAALALAVPSTACLIRTKQPSSSRHQVKNRGHKSCHPSQYWDGHKCRHKGKGKGARKHDGR